MIDRLQLQSRVFDDDRSWSDIVERIERWTINGRARLPTVTQLSGIEISIVMLDNFI